MPDPLPCLVVAIPVLAVVYMAIKWVIKMKKRTEARRGMDRVYYPRRGRKANVPELKR